MQALVKWLLARPHNAVLGLTVTLLLPAPQLTSGALLVLLILAQGPKLAALEAFAAAAMLAVVNVVLGGSFESVVALIAGTWIPVALLAVLLAMSRSLTLATQVAIIVAIAAMLVFQIAVPDQDLFWKPYLEVMVAVVEENGLQLDTSVLTGEVMTITAVLVYWILYTVAMFTGYWLYRQLPFETSNFGRFRELNFGRVIAFATAIASLLAFAIGASWLQNIAFILFVMFMMQGLALVHWLRGEKILPMFALVSIYILLPFLQVLLVMVLALIGYTDAWFGFRRRFTKA